METAYRPRIESGRGDDDDDEKANGADKKQEGAHHRLDEASHGAFEELWRRKRDDHRSVFGKLFERPGSSKEDDDEDDEDEDEEGNKRKKRKKKKQASQAHDTSSAAIAGQQRAETPAKPPEQSEQSKYADTQSPPQTVPHQRQGEGKPAWQKEDDAAFQDIMEREMPEFKDAAPEHILKDADTRPGEPPVTELTTNEAVSLEPEPTQTVEGYRAAEPEQRYQGHTPGPARATEAQPASPTRFEGADQPPVIGTAPPKPLGRVPGPNAGTRTAERGRSLRESMIAATVMTIAIAGYFANRRRKAENRAQQKTINKQHEQIKQQSEAVDHFAANQEHMRQRLADQEAHAAATQQHTAREFAQQRAAFERAQNQSPQAPERTVSQPSPEATARAAGAAPHATEAAKEAQSMEDAQEAARRAVEEARQAAAAAQEPQRRVEQDAWRRYVVDEQGHEVQNVIQYGQEYAHERQQELRDNRQAAGPVGAKPQQPSQHEDKGALLGGAPQLSQHPSATKASGMQQPQKAIDSGLTPSDHSLPAGMPTPADWQHRLPEKKHSQVLAVLTSPWLFLMLSLILLAYFIASLL